MALSKHPNVLRVYGSFVKGSKLYIITPYLSGGKKKKDCISSKGDKQVNKPINRFMPGYHEEWLSGWI
jgi:serine/threonine protein kinase